MALDDNLSIRIDNADLEQFKETCSSKFKRPYSDVLRELIIAVNQGRVSITPTEEQKKAFGELYDVN